MPAMPDQVQVYCHSVQGHPAKRPEVTVMAFAYRGDRGPDDGHRWETYVKSPRLMRSNAANTVTDTLIGNAKYNSRTMGREALRAGEVRYGWNLDCSFCGVKVSVKTETMFEVLDKLREYGVPRIELHQLAATLGSMKQ